MHVRPENIVWVLRVDHSEPRLDMLRAAFKADRTEFRRSKSTEKISNDSQNSLFKNCLIKFIYLSISTLIPIHLVFILAIIFVLVCTSTHICFLNQSLLIHLFIYLFNYTISIRSFVYSYFYIFTTHIFSIY